MKTVLRPEKIPFKIEDGVKKFEVHRFAKRRPKIEDRFERIYKFFFEKANVELTEEDEGYRERLERAWMLLTSLKTNKAVADDLQKTFKVSRAESYYNVRDAMNLFGNPQMQYKDAKRAIAETQYLWGAEKAKEKNDLEMHAKYMDLYSKLNGLNEPEAGTGIEDLVKKFKPVQIVIVAKREDLEAEIKAIQDEVIDIAHKDVEDR